MCTSRLCLKDECLSKDLRKGLKGRGHSLLAKWLQTRTIGSVTEYLALAYPKCFMWSAYLTPTTTLCEVCLIVLDKTHKMCLWVTIGKCKIRTKSPSDLSVHCFYSEQTSLERELMHSYHLKRKAIQNPLLYWASVRCIADNQASKWKLSAFISDIHRETGHILVCTPS